MAGRKGRGAPGKPELGKRGERRAKPQEPAKPPALRGRPPRLAHLIPGSDRNLRRERALAAMLGGPVVSRHPDAPPILANPKDATSAERQADILCLPNPEWLSNILTVVGPSADLADFRSTASGPGAVPWQPDYDRLQEDWLHQLLAPRPVRRGISVEGARILTGQMREAIETLQTQAGQGPGGDTQICALDLHALVPVPGHLLRLGPNDPVVLAWLWENWGTTWMLRHVEEAPKGHAGVIVPEGHDAVCLRFWSADWTPWRALATVRMRWPTLTLHVRIPGIAE